MDAFDWLDLDPLARVSGKRAADGTYIKQRETVRANVALSDYALMGAGRSVRKLLGRYREHLGGERGATEPPTRRLTTLFRWSSSFAWQARIEAWEKIKSAEREARLDARRQEAMETGLALDFERVQALKEVAGFLSSQIDEEDEDGKRPRVWVHDVKLIGAGMDAEKIDIERFNAALIDQFRKLLDDLAKETGGRHRRQDNLNIDLSLLSEEQLGRIVNGENLLSVLATPSKS